MALLVFAALAADAAKTLEKIEAVFATPALSLSYMVRSDRSGEVAGRVRLDEGDQFRLRQGPLDIVCDGKTLVRAGGLAYLETAAGAGLGGRMRRLLARGGVGFWTAPLSLGDGGRLIYAGPDGELELSDLAEGDGAEKSLRYALRHPGVPRLYRVQLFYDPATFRPLRRFVEGAGPPTTEIYTGWALGAEAPVETFALPRPPQVGASVRGRIARKGKLPPAGLSAGCLGAALRTFDGPVDDASLRDLPALDLPGGLSWHPQKGLSYAFKSVAPGKRLVYVHWGERYFDWKWIDVPDDHRTTVPETDFLVDPAATGTVEVEASTEFVLFVPADLDGRVPRWSPRLVGLPLTGRVREGKAVFAGLRPGNYVFYGSGTSWEGTRTEWGEKQVYEAPLEIELIETPAHQVSTALKAGETRRLRLNP